MSETTKSAVGADVHDQVTARADELIAYGETAPKPGRDPINQAMINNWTEAIGDTNPRYSAGEAPPAMAQVWTMRGLNPVIDADDPLHGMMTTLTDLGFTAVLGTNCEQNYDRYLTVGEEVELTTRLESVVGPKRTGVGEGYFVTTKNIWRVVHADGRKEQVASMLFRVLKYIPAQRTGDAEEPENPFVLYPARNQDTEFFWEGTRAHELRIQKCAACGALRHPPGPSCPACHRFERTYDVAAGTGTVFSYVVHRHPPIPGHELPIVLALVDLDEGVRVVAGMPGSEPDSVRVGQRVRVDFRRIDDELTLPIFVAEDGQ